MDRQIEDITELLKRSYEKDAWHGPSVKETLKDLSDEQALRRIANTHSIIELVAHMTAWRRYVIQALKGNATYKVDEAMNFPSAGSWRETIQQLEESQQQLVTTLERFPSGKLYQQIPGKTPPLTFYTLLHGIIHHDLYHSGQIMLIKKAISTQTI